MEDVSRSDSKDELSELEMDYLKLIRMSWKKLLRANED